MKCCTKCGTEKPLSEFGRDKNRSDGLNPWCKACNAANARRWRGADLDRAKATQRASYQRNRESRIAHVHEYAQQHKVEVSALHRKQYQRTREHRLERAREYRLANPVAVAEAKWRAMEKKPDLYRAIGQAKSARRYARLRGALVVPFTREQLADKMAYWGNRCWVCGKPMEQVDHVKPLAKGGPHVLANLRPICRSCNRKKWHQWPLQAVS